jgi:hypothetical protein
LTPFNGSYEPDTSAEQLNGYHNAWVATAQLLQKLIACIAAKEVVPDLLTVLLDYFAIYDLLEFHPETRQRLAILGHQPNSSLALTGREDVEVRTVNVMVP